MICREDAHLALISGYNNDTSHHTYIGGYQTCAVLISKNYAQLQVLQMKIPRKYIGTRAKPNITVNLKGNAKYVYYQ
jgi:hypothetical protein